MEKRSFHMRIIPRAVGLALVLLSVSCAQDAIFDKSVLMGASGAKAGPVDLIVSNTGMTILDRDTTTPVTLDIPYSSIKSLGYTYVDQGKAFLFPIMGISALFVKGQSHWLVIELSGGTANGTTVLRLDKKEYREIIAALTAKSGKRVEMLAPRSTLVDPTAGSHDEDQIVPFPIDQVRAALKLAMEDCFCKVSKSKPGRLECGRAFRPHDSIGGGEAVAAILEPQGQQTQVQIRTGKGFGKNWSSPIYNEKLRTLQAAH
jgi:hypothetical protein